MKSNSQEIGANRTQLNIRLRSKFDCNLGSIAANRNIRLYTFDCKPQLPRDLSAIQCGNHHSVFREYNLFKSFLAFLILLLQTFILQNFNACNVRGNLPPLVSQIDKGNFPGFFREYRAC